MFISIVTSSNDTYRHVGNTRFSALKVATIYSADSSNKFGAFVPHVKEPETRNHEVRLLFSELQMETNVLSCACKSSDSSGSLIFYKNNTPQTSFQEQFSSFHNNLSRL